MPASPTDTGGSPAVAVRSTVLVATDILSGAAAAGVAVSGSAVTGGTTNGSGAVTVTTTSTASPLPVTLTGTGFVTRATGLRFPGPDATVTLIPSSFDLTAFDEMFRVDGLQRWASAPAVVVVTRVVEYNASAGTALPALATEVSGADVQSILDDFAFGLPLLTGNTFRSFASSATVTPATGASVSLMVDGRITVARCQGLLAARGVSGLSRWAFQADGTVTGGMVCLDAEQDAAGLALRRGVRTHELGHALGYQHVSVRASLMNATVTLTGPNDWDQTAARIAFLRPPGNRAPDRDPTGYAPNRQAVRWSEPIG